MTVSLFSGNLAAPPLHPPLLLISRCEWSNEVPLSLQNERGNVKQTAYFRGDLFNVFICHLGKASRVGRRISIVLYIYISHWIMFNTHYRFYIFYSTSALENIYVCKCFYFNDG